MDAGTSPYVGRVADLVNPYLTPAPGLDGSVAAKRAGGQRVADWLEAHPGRWALVFENGMGISADVIRRLGYRFAERDKHQDNRVRVYAQNPHPEGEPLQAALARTEQVLYLPKLEKDPFNWTPEELAEACQVARDNLFPVDGRWNGNRTKNRRKE